MKNYKEDGIPVIEYDFEDWKNGSINEKKYIQFIFRQSSFKSITDNTKKETIYHRIDPTEREKIIKALDEDFISDVQRGFERRKSQFLDQYQSSRDKPLLVDSLIQEMEIRFGLQPDTTKKYIHLSRYQYPQLYKKHIFNGKPYRPFEFFERNERYFETDFLFWKWLKEGSFQPLTDEKDQASRELYQPLIQFNGSETTDKLYYTLKSYFPSQEAELLRALNGEKLDSPILFPHNQNKLSELFRRLKYNGFIASKPGEISKWLNANFLFLYTTKNGSIRKPFNIVSCSEVISTGRGEAKRNERICLVEWLPYKSPSKLSGEITKEQQ